MDRDDKGNLLSPYDTLPPVEIDGAEITVQDGIDSVRAYQEMMFGAGYSEPKAKQGYEELLRRYCRLDTAAMVMIWRHWSEGSAKWTQGLGISSAHVSVDEP
ncbi:MAG: hypothetical protein CL477_00830 [Acidobacteria bacterium]|nr:hypothetical protein [Acidobacteriota bacterium]